MAEPLEPTEVSAGSRVVGYLCPGCALLLVPYVGMHESAEPEEERLARCKKQAAEHCVKGCLRCGGARDQKGWTICNACRVVKRAEEEQKLFDAAAKVPSSEYGEPVYWEGHSGSMGDGYFANPEEVTEYCEGEDIEVPSYVWACTPSKFSLFAEGLIESELETGEFHDGALDQISAKETARLQAFLDEWCAAQDIVSWHTDHSRAVTIQVG